MFEKTLAASLQAPFCDIVESQCDSNNYVDLQGKHIQGQSRVRLLSALKAVYMVWLRLYPGEEEAYEIRSGFFRITF